MPGRRRSRLTDEQTQGRMFDAAREVLEETGGLSVSLEHLSFEEVIQRASVSRSAAYRLWPYKDHFYEDLLVELARPTERGTAELEEQVVLLAAETIERYSSELGSSEGRARVLAEVCRVALQRHFDGMVQTLQWRTYTTLTVTVMSMPEGEARERVAGTLKSTQQSFLDRMADNYRSLSEMLGYRLRPEFENDYRQFAVMAAAVADGLGLRQIVSPEFTVREYIDTRYRLPASAAGQPWRLPSLGFRALVDAMFEPDPTFRPASAPTETVSTDDMSR